MSDIYSEQILFYYKHPKNKGKMANSTFEFSENNPLCGDRIEIQVKLDNQGMVEDIKWDGVGCAISQASASILTQMIKTGDKKHLDDLRNIKKEDLLEMLGIQLSPNRLKCALLSLGTLKSGILTYIGQKESGAIPLHKD